MTTVTVEGVTRTFDGGAVPWIRDSVRARASRGLLTCVEVSIQSGPVRITLSTPACGGRGGGYEPNSDEQKIVDLWRKRGLSEFDWDVGQLIAFLNEIKHLK